MKKLLIIVMVAIFMGLNMNAQAQADTVIGYANYKKIEQSYEYAKRAYKEIDAKVLELQQFVIDKDKEFKNIDSPVKKKAFEEKTQKDYKAKEDAILALKTKKEDEIFNNIMVATNAVAKSKKIDVVLDYRVIFTGGTDISNEVIQYLNTRPNPTAKK